MENAQERKQQVETTVPGTELTFQRRLHPALQLSPGSQRTRTSTLKPFRSKISLIHVIPFSKNGWKILGGIEQREVRETRKGPICSWQFPTVRSAFFCQHATFFASPSDFFRYFLKICFETPCRNTKNLQVHQNSLQWAEICIASWLPVYGEVSYGGVDKRDHLF